MKVYLLVSSGYTKQGMKLQEFLDYKKDCPMCGYPLKTIFHSRRQQSQSIENNKLMFFFKLSNIKRNSTEYKVAYSFDTTDNSLSIEFYNKEGVKFENESPEFLRIRFWELDKNLKGYRFYKECNNSICRRYMYESNHFTINYKAGTIDELKIVSEFVGLSQPTEDGYKIMRMFNNHLTNQTNLVITKASEEIWAGINYSINNNFGGGYMELNTPLIKFSSKEETTDRISKLLVFS